MRNLILVFVLVSGMCFGQSESTCIPMKYILNTAYLFKGNSEILIDKEYINKEYEEISKASNVKIFEYQYDKVVGYCYTDLGCKREFIFGVEGNLSIFCLQYKSSSEDFFREASEFLSCNNFKVISADHTTYTYSFLSKFDGIMITLSYNNGFMKYGLAKKRY